MRDVIVEFSYDRFLVGHTNGLDYHYIAFTHCLHRNVTAVMSYPDIGRHIYKLINVLLL
mgnify:CR=1 FL=1